MRRGRSDGERWFTPRAKGEDDVDEGGVSPTRRSPSPLALARPPRRRATWDAPITADDPTPPVSAVGAAAPSSPSASARGSGRARRPSNDASNEDEVDLGRLQVDYQYASSSSSSSYRALCGRRRRHNVRSRAVRGRGARSSVVIKTIVGSATCASRTRFTRLARPLTRGLRDSHSRHRDDT